MNIIINRTSTNNLYTTGTLVINHEPQAHTLEATQTMLPAGLYRLQLVTIHAHLRELIVHDWHTGKPLGIRLSITAHTHIGCQKERAIAIGQELIPGALYKAHTHMERLVKRLEKCQKRHEPILLIIDDTMCKAGQPIKHWKTL